MSRGVKARLSRWAGAVAGAGWSRALIPAFVRRYRVDTGEAEHPVSAYPSLQAFFCRQLRPGLRPVDPSAAVVSPVDATVGACGVIADGQLLQAKGLVYTLADLLGDERQAARFQGGVYCTLYLAPPDYHRIHAPIDGRIGYARYLPGRFFPVNARAVRTVRNLFASNERLVTYVEGERFAVALVKVGACLVGAIRTVYDPGWNAGPASERHYDPPLPIARGQQLGYFEFGSTVIALIAPEAGVKLRVAPGEKVRVGQALAD